MKKITAINKAIQSAIINVAAKTAKPLQEPDYCAVMAIELPPLVNASKAFPGVIFSGCFIHQSPKASFAGKYPIPSACEVGDLLVVCHNVVDGDDRYNAALIQWKIVNSGEEKISGSALKQLDLYEHWPLFTLNSCQHQYDIQPKTVTPGAQYGLILEGTKQVSLFCSIPAMTLKTADSPSFARFIINMMKWQTGRPVVIDGPEETRDEWSNIILHLLMVSLNKRFNRRNVKYEDCPRASTGLLQMLLQGSFYGKEEVQVATNAEPEDEGISILYIDMATEKAQNSGDRVTD